MTKQSGLSLVAVLLTISASLTGQAPPRFSARTGVVLVDVQLTRTGRPVADLQARDFEVRDNGVVQRVELLASSDVPINLVLALDTSSTMTGSALSDLKAASHAVLAALSPPDRASLLTFSHAVAHRVQLTSDLSEVKAALDSLSPYGETAILDGVYLALATIQPEPGRSLVILCTDGRDTSSWLQPAEVLESAKRSNAVIYAVSTGRARRWSLFRELAEVTSGSALEPEAGTSLRAQLEKIIEDFRHRVVLAFTPTGVPEGGFHRIDVRVGKNGVKVKARPGYIRGGPGA
jgi:VWFA-related protein